MRLVVSISSVTQQKKQLDSVCYLKERRETTVRLQQELAIAKQNFEQDEIDSLETRKRILEKQAELKQKECLLEKTSQVSKNLFK